MRALRPALCRLRRTCALSNTALANARRGFTPCWLARAVPAMLSAFPAGCGAHATASRRAAGATERSASCTLARQTMNILLLCEGDAESWDSWSGITKSLVDHLRTAGHTVMSGDVDLAGADRWLAAALTFAVDRRRWGTRFHLSRLPFRLRSRRAARRIAAHRNRVDAIVQVGATFQPLGRGTIPYFLC